MKYIAKLLFVMIFSIPAFSQAEVITLEEYKREIEAHLTDQLVNTKEITKDYKIKFEHIYIPTRNEKDLKSPQSFDCQFQKNEKRGICKITTTYLIEDPDCWSCGNPFQTTKEQ